MVKWPEAKLMSWMESVMQAELRVCEVPAEHESPGDWLEPAVDMQTMGWEDSREVWSSSRLGALSGAETAVGADFVEKQIRQLN